MRSVSPRPRPGAAVLSDGDARARLAAVEAELLVLRRSDAQLRRELALLRRDLLAFAERIHAQSELLSRRAERKEA